MKVDRFIN